MAGRNWREDDRSDWRGGRGDEYGRGSGRDYGRGGGEYGRGRDDWDYSANPRRRHYYEGGDWGADRGGGPGDYGQQFARNVRRDDYGADFPDANPFGGNRSFEYDDFDHPAPRSYRHEPKGSYDDRNRDYGRERGGAFWNSDADNRRDWELNRRDWELNRRGWSSRDYGRGYGEERGFWDRASDEVASWFGDEEAERRRRQDHHRGRGPRNYTRSSDRIREDVSDRLTDDWRVDASDIEVTVSGTEVTLSGTVSDREQRRRAEDIAESVSGITHVQNNLRVKPRNQPAGGSDTFAGVPGDTSGGSGLGTLGSPTGTGTRR